jgi:hypothetical protein
MYKSLLHESEMRNPKENSLPPSRIADFDDGVEDRRRISEDHIMGSR